VPQIILVNRKGEEMALEATAGISIMENIRNAGVDELLALCGGVLSCATCHVFVDQKWMDAVGEPADTEADMLGTTTHQQPTSRLSCQIQMRDALDGLRVTLAPEE
jgi:ferredoxin, 2Fe-2S